MANSFLSTCLSRFLHLCFLICPMSRTMFEMSWKLNFCVCTLIYPHFVAGHLSLRYTHTREKIICVSYRVLLFNIPLVSSINKYIFSSFFFFCPHWIRTGKIWFSFCLLIFSCSIFDMSVENAFLSKDRLQLPVAISSQNVFLWGILLSVVLLCHLGKVFWFPPIIHNTYQTIS